jgi:hypothetical protein
MSVWAEYWHTLTDPAHILVELTFITGEAVIITPLVALAVKLHDRRKHPKVGVGVSTADLAFEYEYVCTRDDVWGRP